MWLPERRAALAFFLSWVPYRSGMTLDQEDWAEIARLWLSGTEPVGQIATRYGITHQKITARARAERWPPRGSASGPVLARHAEATRADREPSANSEDVTWTEAIDADGIPASKRAGTNRAAARQAMAERLFDAMDTKLSAIEKRIAEGGDATPADSERTTRALNTLVRSLEKLADYEGKISGKAGSKDGQRRRAGDDPERRRQELARRIERLLKRR